MYIPQNKIIYPYMLTTKDDIIKGQTIYVISKSGAIEISFQAKALQNGKKGDIIKVKKDNKIFSVKIDKFGNGIL
jgi:flagella basal body P-ring formation protein FlgA